MSVHTGDSCHVCGATLDDPPDAELAALRAELAEVTREREDAYAALRVLGTRCTALRCHALATYGNGAGPFRCDEHAKGLVGRAETPHAPAIRAAEQHGAKR